VPEVTSAAAAVPSTKVANSAEFYGRACQCKGGSVRQQRSQIVGLGPELLGVTLYKDCLYPKKVQLIR
jgi:hypothetical protein